MLSKKYRISSTLFKELKSNKPTLSIVGSYFYLKYYKDSEPRFGFVIQKRHVSKATTRNLLKRRLSSIVFLNISRFKPGNYVFITKRPLSNEVNYEKINIEINYFLSEVFKS